MRRANLEGASLMACNFEDPTGVKSANLEGTRALAHFKSFIGLF